MYVGINAYGWRAWLHGGTDAGALPVSRLPARAIAVTLAAVVVLTALFATVLANALGSTVPLWDGLTTALSLAAIALQTRRVLENWWFWIAADVVYVPLYLYKRLPLTAALYGIFLGLCVAGLIAWQRRLRAAAA